MKQESESAPRVATRRTIVFRLILEKLPASRKLLYAGCVRPAVGTHPCARQCSSHSVGWRPSRQRDPTDVATGPAAWCPPVCQGTTFPLRRNGRIILYRAVWRKGGKCKKHETRAIRRGRKDGTADSDACIDSKETRPP